MTATLASIFLTACSSPVNVDLNDVHSSIESRYSEVKHISAAELRQRSTDNLIIFDTRQPEEFTVSHIKGALQIDPAISVSDFISNYGALIGDKDVVFYCSVGERSSRVAARLQSRLSSPVYNLEKGVFGWHNARLPLLSQSQSTDYIHPYDDEWGRLVARQDKVRYEPE